MNFTQRYTVDLARGKQEKRMPDIMVTGDNAAQTIEVEVLKDGAPVQITGTVTGQFIRGIGAEGGGITVPLTGSAEGNVASVTLSRACYYTAGAFQLTITVTDAESTTSIFIGVGNVILSASDQISNDEQVIPSLQEIQAATINAQAATSAANTAAGKANTAAGAANTAAGQATTAAQTANTAAGQATTAAQTANTAAQKIDGMTVSAKGLTAGSSPTAVISEQGGGKHIAFGIPQGEKGDAFTYDDFTPEQLEALTGPQGPQGETGPQGATGATGATPEITIGTVTTGAPGTDASATMTGTPEAPVLSLTIPRGMPGEGNVLSVAGVMPDEDGDVPLSAADIGALAVDAQAADSAKLGGKAPEYYLQPRNLLDNSDFTNPVNQRGETVYNGIGYTIDRWSTYISGNTVTVNDGGISQTGEQLLQILEKSTLDKTKIYTFAARKKDGTIRTISGTFDNGFHDNYLSCYIGDGDSNFYTVLLEAATYTWAALYEGSYTIDTLPPYVPKGYAAELSECLRYYQAISTTAYCYANTFLITNNFSEMRIAPSLISGKVADGTQLNVDNEITISNCTKSSIGYITSSIATSGITYRFIAILSADL